MSHASFHFQNPQIWGQHIRALNGKTMRKSLDISVPSGELIARF